MTTHGQVIFHTREGHLTRHLSHDGVRVRIPLGNDLAAVDLLAVFNGNYRTVGDLIALTLTALGIGHRQLTGARYRHQVAVFVGHQLNVNQADATFLLNLNIVSCRSTRSRTTDVEGTHGQLSTGLTD